MAVEVRTLQQFHQLKSLISSDDCVVLYKSIPLVSHRTFHAPIPDMDPAEFKNKHRFVYLDLSLDPELETNSTLKHLLAEKNLFTCSCPITRLAQNIEENPERIFYKMEISILTKTLFKGSYHPTIDSAIEFKDLKTAHRNLHRLKKSAIKRKKMIERAKIICCPIALFIQLLGQFYYCTQAPCYCCSDSHPSYVNASNLFCEGVNPQIQYCCIPIFRQSPHLLYRPSPYLMCDERGVELYESVKGKEYLSHSQKKEMEKSITQIVLLKSYEALWPFIKGVQRHSGIIDTMLIYLTQEERHPLGYSS